MTNLILPLSARIHEAVKADAVEVAVLADKRRERSWAEWDFYVRCGHEPCWAVTFDQATADG